MSSLSLKNVDVRCREWTPGRWREQSSVQFVGRSQSCGTGLCRPWTQSSKPFASRFHALLANTKRLPSTFSKGPERSIRSERSQSRWLSKRRAQTKPAYFANPHRIPAEIDSTDVALLSDPSLPDRTVLSMRAMHRFEVALLWLNDMHCTTYDTLVQKRCPQPEVVRIATPLRGT